MGGVTFTDTVSNLLDILESPQEVRKDRRIIELRILKVLILIFLVV
jgi:hypothetical protein